MKYPKFPIRNSLKSLIGNFVLRKPIPILLSLDITHRCNAKCPFCGFWNSDPCQEMSNIEIFKVLDDAYDLGCLTATFTGGEPLLRSDIPELAKHADDCGLSSFLLTNGYLLKERIEEIHRYLDVISVSIDFPDSRHDKIRCINGLFEKAVQGIRTAQSHGLTTNINSIITNEHAPADAEKLLALARELNCGITFAPLFRVPEFYTHTSNIGRLSDIGKEIEIAEWDHVRTIMDKIIYHKKHDYRKTIQNTAAYLELVRDRGDFVCYPLSLQIGVSTNGDVSSVCPIGVGAGHYIGNVMKESLKEIWYSTRAENLRREFRNCRMAKKVGCYLLCVAEFSLLYGKRSTVVDYVRRII